MARAASAVDVRFGSKADICDAKAMSALPPKADMCGAKTDVRFVPIADVVVIYDPSVDCFRRQQSWR